MLKNEVLSITFIDPKEAVPDCGKTCLLKIGFDDDNGHYCITGYYEHGFWYTFNGCGQRVHGSDIVVGWRYMED